MAWCSAPSAIAAFAWRYASTLWPVSRSIGDGLVTLAMAMWVLLSMAFISRAIRFPGERAAGDASSGEQQLRQPVSGHHAVGGDWFGSLVLAAGDRAVCAGRGAADSPMPPGKAVGYGGGTILARPPRRGCICRQ
ncbi:hypothetical protein ACB272_14415 [Klebsiella pneumoniae]